MTIYTIEPGSTTLHGSFSREYPPVLTIGSGESVHYRTLDAGWHLGPFTDERTAHKFERRVKDLDRGHALCGPVAIRGAQPGMILEVHVNEVRPDTWGWTIGGCDPNERNKRLGVAEECEVLHWTLDSYTLPCPSCVAACVALPLKEGAGAERNFEKTVRENVMTPTCDSTVKKSYTL